jgi:hypothetical protein
MSQIATHSPGPWEFVAMHPSTIDAGVVTVHSDRPIERIVIRRVYRDAENRRCTQYIGEVFITAGREEEAEPTARVITAALDLLAALKLAEPVLADEVACLVNSYSPVANAEEQEDLDSTQAALVAVRAAIAKAEGRT